MEKIIFTLKPIINLVVKQLSESYFEKKSIRRKLKKISTFSKEFDNSIIDTYSFQQFLDEETTRNLIFEYVFSARFINMDRVDFILKLSETANEFINQKNIHRGASNYDMIDVLKDYFDYLLVNLENFRITELNHNQNILIANIHSGILESNNEIKIYLDQKFIELDSYTLAKTLTEEKIEELLYRSIESLGNRYTENANVSTKSNLLFKSLTFEKDIYEYLMKKNQKLASNLNLLLIELKKFEHEIGIEENQIIIESISSLGNYDFSLKRNYIKSNLNTYFACQEKISNILSNLKYLIYELDRNDYRYDNLIGHINETNRLINDVSEYIQSIGFELINEPHLVINGDGGIGKSHLLADQSKQLHSQGHIVFLFLGQHFSSKESPFKQIFDFLEYSGDSDSFLFEINIRAQKSGKNAVIFIDALNEGQGKYFWKDYIIDFLLKIKKYPFISLVLSNRTNYMKSIFPEAFFKNHGVTLYEHKGFTDLTLNQLAPFLEYYKINSAIVPQLQSECMNPLFLKMYCEVAENQNNDFNGWSITKVLSKYSEIVNSKLAIDERFSYTEKINVINLCLEQIARKMLANGHFDLSIEEAHQVVVDVAKDYMASYHNFLSGLLEENILASSRDYSGNEIIYFSFERFGDIYIAREIINSRLDNKNFLDASGIEVQLHSGIYEALSILLPEDLNIEIFETIKEDEYSYEVVESFVKGLSWRKPSTITDKTIPFLDWCIDVDKGIRNLVYEQLIKFSYLEHNILNSDYLHNHLFKMSLAERDSKWTIFINERPDILNRIMNLVINNKNNSLNEQTTNLLATSITWLFTSSHRVLRDNATYTLVHLLQNNMEITLPTLIKFKDINDPYLYERLFAAIYGATLRTKKREYIKAVSEYIFSEVFQKEDVYPHILLRDYARGTLLYANYLGEFNPLDLNCINPPYNSKWYDSTPTLDDIDNLKMIYSEEKFGKKSYSVQSIIHSMTTEYGRGTSAYGDFGRYTFESALRSWKNQFEAQDLSNIATMRVFSLGYDIETHGEYDLMNGRYYDRHTNILERIGKKYQWIAFHELLAKLSDNYSIYEEEVEYSVEYNSYLEEKQDALWRFITQEKSDSGVRDDVVETEELNPDEHIINIKRTMVPFNGPWEPFVRDIDCTLLINKKMTRDKFLVNYNIPEQPSKEWTLTNIEINNVANLFEIMFEGECFISLAHLYVNKRENGSKYGDRDEFAVKTKAVFVKKDSFDEYILTKIKRKGGNGVPWRMSHKSFSYEHFWHPSFADMVNQDELDNDELYEIDSVWDYLWENQFDYSTDESSSISYLMPSAELVSYFKLEQDQEGVWRDSSNKIIALDASLLGYESCLLFKKESIDEFLNRNEFLLLWDAYFEKNSDKYYHEWWLLYWKVGTDYKYEILQEEQGATR